MSDMNVVVLSGRLVKDPELRFTPRGVAVASLRMASSRYYRARDAAENDFKKQSLFISAEVFGKLAERVVEKRKKGDPLMVKGRLELNEWTDKEGKPRQTYRLCADEVRSLAPAKKPVEEGGEHKTVVCGREAAAVEEMDEPEDDIPF